ncbi:MAG TPA: sodium:solute symporter family protein [Bryobacteraceae bacterium]|jgi:SSS family solute:Na+ symporter
MNSSFLPIGIISVIVLLGTGIGLLAGSRRKMNLEQWTVGGRGFGLILVWLLMAGEVYTTFAFLGASGWAYSRGAPALYILAYITLGYVVSFFILPPIWELGRKFSLQTQSDFFETRYKSKTLAALVSLSGVAFLIPYLEIQITGLGIIAQISSFDRIGRTPAMILAVTLVAAFVFAGGIRAVAWVSILKDVLMIFAALAVGIGVPYMYFGGIRPMFSALAHTRPAHLVMPGATANMGHAWYISTVLLTSLGFYMWPHTFAAAFTARSAAVLRRNAIVMPLYTLSLIFIFFTGFTALLVIPGLANGDLALFTLVRKAFPNWFLGVIGGAGALTAMVPAAILLLTAATLFAKNVYRPFLAPAMSESQIARLARAMVIVLSLVTLYFAIYSSTTLVSLLLLGYAGVTQFFPGIVLGLYSNRVTKSAVFAGLLAGLLTLCFLTFSNHDPFLGINAGFFALCLNLAVTFVFIRVNSWPKKAPSLSIPINPRSTPK